MKTAYIPPIPNLAHFGTGDFHLLLSHLLDDDRYLSHYERMRQKGAYLILDNSAHEHVKGESARKLSQQASLLNAQEVVVPDCLEDGEKTVQLAVSALEYWYESRYGRMAQLNPALMYVPQGKNREEWADCFTTLCNLHHYMSRRKDFRRDFVVGISKDYEPWAGGLLSLIRDYVSPLRSVLEQAGVKMHVHMLGWPRDLWSLNRLALAYTWIRSTDSAKPFVYARAGVKLNPRKSPPAYPTRQQDYFGTSLEGKGVALALHNCKVFNLAATGNLEVVSV